MFKIIDLFGYQVRLNVDKDNKTHKTVVGAVLSLVYVATFIYIFILCLGSNLFGGQGTFMDAGAASAYKNAPPVQESASATSGARRMLNEVVPPVAVLTPQKFLVSDEAVTTTSPAGLWISILDKNTRKWNDMDTLKQYITVKWT